MCVPASFVLTAERAYWSPTDESHEAIIAKHHLRETDASGQRVNILRVEVTPPEDRWTAPLEEWRYKVDQKDLPAWAEDDPAGGEARARAELPRWLAGKTRLYLSECTALTALPDLPAVEWLDLSSCTGLTALPDLPAVRTLDLSGCTGLTALGDLPAVEWLDLRGCTGLTALPDLPAVRTLDLRGCTGLTALGDLPAVTWLNLRGCTGKLIEAARAR